MKSLLLIFLPCICFSRAFVRIPNLWNRYTPPAKKEDSNWNKATSSIISASKRIPVLLKSSRRSISRVTENELTITQILIFSNVVMYALTKGIPVLNAISPIFAGNHRLFNKLMKIDAAIARGQSYRLFTACFVHGNLMHLLANCWSLSAIGPESERIFGKDRFLVYYLGSGVLAGLVTYAMRSSPYSVGASGCIFGLIGAMGAFYYANRSILGRRSQIGLDSIKRTLMLNLFYGMSARGIDNGAHIAGAICGAFMSLLLGPRLHYGGYSFGRSRVVDKPILPIIRMIRHWLEGKDMEKDPTMPPELPGFRSGGKGLGPRGGGSGQHDGPQSGSGGGFSPRRPPMR